MQKKTSMLMQESSPQMNVSTGLATFYPALNIEPKVSVNLVPAIYTSFPRALKIFDCQ